MPLTHVAGVDLNLLPLLDALLTERHVTRAAKRVGLSQPAASRGLARLREIVGDPLLVRTGRGWALTGRAERLREPVHQALGLVEGAVLRDEGFDLATTRRTVRVASDDYCQIVVLAHVLARFGAEAPGLDLWIVPSAPTLEAQADALVRGDVDFVLGPIRPGERRTPGVHAEQIVEDRYVGVARSDHPLLRGPVTLEAFAAARHAFIAPGGRPGGAVDDALAALGRERRVALAAPYFVVTPWLVARSDLVLTLGERLARCLARDLPLGLFDPPLALPTFLVGFSWHERDRHDPLLAWVRAAIRASAADLDAPGQALRDEARRGGASGPGDR